MINNILNTPQCFRCCINNSIKWCILIAWLISTKASFAQNKPYSEDEDKRVVLNVIIKDSNLNPLNLSDSLYFRKKGITKKIRPLIFEKSPVYLIDSIEWGDDIILKIDTEYVRIDNIWKHISYSERATITIRYSPLYKCIKVLSNPDIDVIPVWDKDDYKTKCFLIYIANSYPPIIKKGKKIMPYSYYYYVQAHRTK